MPPREPNTACPTSATDDVSNTLAETLRALNGRKNGSSWRSLAREIGISHAILCYIKAEEWEHVSWEAVRRTRVALGIPDPGEIVQTIACPDCGSVHTGRCHGEQVAEVVVVPVGKRAKLLNITTTQRAPRGAIYVSKPVWKRLREARLRAGLTWDQFLTPLLEDDHAETL